MSLAERPNAPRADRLNSMLRFIDLTTGPGLEIGPLFSPMVGRDEADVYYTDISDQASLQKYYSTHPGTPIDDIVDVDFPLSRDGGAIVPLKEATNAKAPFKWAVASHVVEHVPDIIGWLRDVGSILENGGHLSLAVPDRRYSFDAIRPPTTVGQMLLAHRNNDTRPSIRAVFDHYRDVASVEATAVWQGTTVGTDDRIFNLAMAHGMLERARNGEYMDCHVWLFTPRTFVEQLHTLVHLGLLDFTVAHLEPTRRNDLEFFVTLRRLDRNLDIEGVRTAVASGFDSPSESSIGRFNAGQSGFYEAGEKEVLLSRRELQVLDLKRRSLESIRKAVATWRQRNSQYHERKS